MSNDFNYTIQFKDKELNQLAGDLYYYFRHLKYNLDYGLELQDHEEDRIDKNAKEYLTNQF